MVCRTYSGASFFQASAAQQGAMRQCWGITYQSGGLFSAMTLADNVALPLQLYTGYDRGEIADIVAYKLALVGLAGYQDYYPSEISGGMCKRAALARAIALDPEILFFDEPSAGLDPISSRLLDNLIVQLKESTGATVVMVTHEDDIAQYAHRIIRLRDGLIESDTINPNVRKVGKL